MVYFSDIFNIDESVLEAYGAFNISLINDLPLFIDPFLLYASNKPEYKQLHEDIIQYLVFLKSKAESGALTPVKIARWYKFPEVKEVWLGYSEMGNRGSGLGLKFGNAMSDAMVKYFTDLGREQVSETSHLEKLGLFKSGVGKDNISDFTCNLIKKYLLEYTQSFARQYLQPTQCSEVSVAKAYFDYELESWMSATYYLPFFNGSYVILTPKDILTKDETWINFTDMQWKFRRITDSIPNEELRDRINDLYLKRLPDNPKDKDIKMVVESLVNQFPEVMDYYIKLKESDKEGAKSSSRDIVSAAQNIFIKNIARLIDTLGNETSFYDCASMGSYEASRQRVMFLKDVIENQDGYRLFYHNGKPVSKEKDLQLLFKFTWFATVFDVNAEANNGRGPVDYKVSFGGSDKTLVEFKLAKNSKLKDNIKNQVQVYEAANGTHQSMKVILYFNDSEYIRVKKVLKELELENNPNIILIDASPKESASNVK